MGAPRIHKITISKTKAADLVRRCGSALGVARAIGMSSGCCVSRASTAGGTVSSVYRLEAAWRALRGRASKSRRHQLQDLLYHYGTAKRVSEEEEGISVHAISAIGYGGVISPDVGAAIRAAWEGIEAPAPEWPAAARAKPLARVSLARQPAPAKPAPATVTVLERLLAERSGPPADLARLEAGVARVEALVVRLLAEFGVAVQDGTPAKRQPSGGASDAVETQSRQGGS